MAYGSPQGLSYVAFVVTVFETESSYVVESDPEESSLNLYDYRHVPLQPLKQVTELLCKM